MELSKRIFFFLQGQWLIERSTNGHGKMEGMASFVPLQDDPQTLLYREEGEYLMPSGIASFSFFKEYMYGLNQEYLEAYFTYHGKKFGLFHRLILSEVCDKYSARAYHSCGQDTYIATYQFVDSNTFTLHYDIQGPKKNLRIQTHFKRQNPTHTIFF